VEERAARVGAPSKPGASYCRTPPAGPFTALPDREYGFSVRGRRAGSAGF